MRLFVGLPLPDGIRERLGEAVRGWRGQAPHLKWVHPSLYHFTLQFLGETDSARVPELCTALDGLADRPAFSLQPGSLITLPRGPRARVLAIGLAEGAEALAGLAAAVQEATEALGFEQERRPFRAHLTLARARRGDSLGLDPESLELPISQGFKAQSFHLYESELRPEGPLYRSIREIPLSLGDS